MVRGIIYVESQSLLFLFLLVLSMLIPFTPCEAPGKEAVSTPSSVEDKDQNEEISRPKSDKSSLIQAHMQFRTGLYNPNSLSENKAEVYPGLLLPFTELPNLVLTNEGKAQMFKLGVFLRWWYGSVLNYTYDPLQYRMLSSTGGWNIESANVVAAGMFPIDTNDTEKRWNPDLNYWPIPVHLDNRITRRGPTVLLEGTEPACPRIRNIIISSNEYNIFLDEWEWLWEYLCENAKTPGDADFMEAVNVAAVLMVDALYPEKLPSWANTTIVKSSIEMYFHYLNMLSGFYDALRLSTGWFWELVLLEFNRAINGESQRKIIQYSSHNDMLTACLRSISGPISMWPDWGAGFSIELHKRGDDYIVEAWGWMNPNVPEPLFLNITDCSVPCTLQEFSRILSKYHVTDPRFECGTVQPAENSLFPRAMFAVFLLCSGICLISMFLMIREYNKYKKD